MIKTDGKPTIAWYDGPEPPDDPDNIIAAKRAIAEALAEEPVQLGPDPSRIVKPLDVESYSD